MRMNSQLSLSGNSDSAYKLDEHIRFDWNSSRTRGPAHIFTSEKLISVLLRSINEYFHTTMLP